MRGGSQEYIDRAPITDNSIIDFPRRWFTSVLQRPRTLLLSLDINGETINSFVKEKGINLLKKMEVPVSYSLYSEMKKAVKISDLLALFKNKMGDFTEEFYAYDDVSSGMRLRTQPLVFSLSKEVSEISGLRIPDIDFDPRDPDYAKAAPSFGSIFLEVLRQEKVTVRPRIADYQPANSNISLQIDLIKQPDQNLNSGVIPLLTLEKAVKPFEFNSQGRNFSTLNEVLAELKKERGIVVNASGFSGQAGSLPDLEGLSTFTDIMDTISSFYSAYWDWVGDRVVMKKIL